MLRGEIQKHVEHREEDFKTYDELRSVGMKWAINKKIERERLTKGDPMDCSQIDRQQAKEAIKELLEAATNAAAENCETDPDAWDQSQDDAVDIDHTQKGKSSGKGKGLQGNKGPMTPMQIVPGIRNMGLGKAGGKSLWDKASQSSKGSGKGNQVCYKCNKTGHIARYCTNSTAQEARRCRKRGKMGHLEKHCRSAIATREVDEEEEESVNWGTCVVDEYSEPNAIEVAEGPHEIRAAADQAGEPKGKSAEPRWRSKVKGGHRIRFVLNSGTTRSNPRDEGEQEDIRRLIQGCKWRNYS